MALITTFATTPLTTALYPHWYQVKIAAWKRGEIDWDGNRLTEEGTFTELDETIMAKRESSDILRLLAYLRLDNMPGILSLVSLLSHPVNTISSSRVHPGKGGAVPAENSSLTHHVGTNPLQIHGVRLMELTDRASSVMKVAEIDEYTMRDPIVNTFRTFGQLRNLPVSGDVMVVPEALYATTLNEKAADISADMVLIPWSVSGTMSENESEAVTERFATGPFSHFVLTTLRQATCNTAILVDNGFSIKRRLNEPTMLTKTVSARSARSIHPIAVATTNKGYHILLPYIGSEDDKAALRLVLQLAKDTTVTATIVHFEKIDEERAHGWESVAQEDLTSKAQAPGKFQKSTHHTSISTLTHDSYSNFFHSMRDSLSSALASRITFQTIPSASQHHDIMAKVKEELERVPKDIGDLVVLGRNLQLDAALSAGPDIVAVEAEARQALGPVAAGILSHAPRASLLVVRTAG